LDIDSGDVGERFQQVYDASLFAAFPGGVNIDVFAPRGDGFIGRGFTWTLTGVEIHFSTTRKAVDGLSPSFDENVGTDDRIVAGPGPFVLDGGGTTTGERGVWTVYADIRDHPFFYNPAAGNLLVDIKVPRGTLPRTSAMDAVNVFGDSVSTVYSVLDSLPGMGQLDTRGMVTLFTVHPVPEPSAGILLLLSLAGAVVWFRKRLFTRDIPHVAH
jgi:hypothetical protein